jgi:quercetin dioxygenase-like cupin family protein
MKKLFVLFAVSLVTFKLLAQERWVEVRNEERHHLVFENSYVRILNVFIGPGDTTRYHRHNTPSVFILLSTTKVVSQLMGGQPVASTNIFAQTLTFDSLTKERIHRVINVDTNWMHVMDVEITAKNPKGKIQKLHYKQLAPLFTKPMLNGYKLSLAANEKFSFHGSSGGYLLVSLSSNEISIESNGTPENYLMKAGHYLWIGANEKRLLHNHNSPAEFAVLQF